jgi:hypothetical protein
MVTPLEILAVEVDITPELALVTSQIQRLYNTRKSAYEAMKSSIEDSYRRLSSPTQEAYTALMTRTKNEYYPVYRDFQVIKNVKYFHETYIAMLIPNTKLYDNWDKLYTKVQADVAQVNIDITSLESQFAQYIASNGNSNTSIQPLATALTEKSELKNALESACMYAEYLKRFMGDYFNHVPAHDIGDIIQFVDPAGILSKEFEVKAIISQKDFELIEGCDTLFPNIYSVHLPNDISTVKFYYGTLTLFPVDGGSVKSIMEVPMVPIKFPYILWDDIIEVLIQLHIILL